MARLLPRVLSSDMMAIGAAAHGPQAPAVIYSNGMLGIGHCVIDIEAIHAQKRSIRHKLRLAAVRTVQGNIRAASHHTDGGFRFPGCARVVGLVGVVCAGKFAYRLLQAITPDVLIQEDDCAGLVPQHLHSSLGIIDVCLQIFAVAVDQWNVGILHIGVSLKVRKVLLHIFLNVDDGRTGHEEHIVPDGAPLLKVGAALVGKGR